MEDKNEVTQIDKYTTHIKGIGYGRSIGKPDIAKMVRLLLKHKYITG